jgi:hypothetical protein
VPAGTSRSRADRRVAGGRHRPHERRATNRGGADPQVQQQDAGLADLLLDDARLHARAFLRLHVERPHHRQPARAVDAGGIGAHAGGHLLRLHRSCALDLEVSPREHHRAPGERSTIHPPHGAEHHAHGAVGQRIRA